MMIPGLVNIVVGSMLLLPSAVPVSPSAVQAQNNSTVTQYNKGEQHTTVTLADSSEQTVPSQPGNHQPSADTLAYRNIDLIDHIEWRKSTFGRTIKVYPTSWLRLNGGSYDIGEAAWDELMEKYRTSVTKNSGGLRDQFICHVERGPIKDTYNLDEWLEDVSYEETVEADCQPGKDD